MASRCYLGRLSISKVTSQWLVVHTIVPLWNSILECTKETLFCDVYFCFSLIRGEFSGVLSPKVGGNLINFRKHCNWTNISFFSFRSHLIRLNFYVLNRIEQRLNIIVACVENRFVTEILLLFSSVASLFLVVTII